MRIGLKGRFDAAWSNTVNKALQDAIQGGCHHIVLDLSQVSYLSSAGIRVLVLLLKNLKSIGGSLQLSEPSAAVGEVLKLVGFNQLMASSAAPATVQPPSPSPPPLRMEARPVQLAGHEFAVYALDPDAVQQGAVMAGNTLATAQPIAVAVDDDSWVIGLGCLGGDANTKRAGELLAVSGLAISLPGDDPEHPDWLQQEGELIAQVGVLHGLRATGPFRYLLRFGETPETPSLRLSELAEAALELCASDRAAWVIVAETAHLIGAALQMPSNTAGEDFFAFPNIRDRLLFTAEPAYAKETCLIVGAAARNPAPPLAAQMRPCAEGGNLFMHAHACIVPFAPVRKGFISLPESLEKLMDAQTVLGVLHLLNDDREGVGAGESYLRRGALWCAPVNFNEGSSV